VELEEVHMSLDPGEAVDVDHVATAAIDIGLTAGTVIAAVGEIAPGPTIRHLDVDGANQGLHVGHDLHEILEALR